MCCQIDEMYIFLSVVSVYMHFFKVSSQGLLKTQESLLDLCKEHNNHERSDESIVFLYGHLYSFLLLFPQACYSIGPSFNSRPFLEPLQLGSVNVPQHYNVLVYIQCTFKYLSLIVTNKPNPTMSTYVSTF